MTAHPIVSDAHALLAGQVWGIGLRAGLDLRPVVDEAGNYTAELELVLPEGRLQPDVTSVRIVVQPPLVEEVSGAALTELGRRYTSG